MSERELASNASPFFSIISVSFNNIAGLKKTLTSLEKQEFKNFEVIIVDGGSSDGTQDFVKKVNHSSIKFISEKDKGIYDAQNKGVKLASGKYLLFLNAGDSFQNDQVLQKIKDSAKMSEDILYGDILMIDREKRQIPVKYPDTIVYKYWYRQKYLCHQAIFFHRRIFDTYGMYNLTYRFAADFDLLQRIWYQPETTKRHVDTLVVIYDLEGVSAKKENESLIHKEYDSIKKKNHPLFTYLWYSTLYETIFFYKVRHSIHLTLNLLILIKTKLFNFPRQFKNRFLYLTTKSITISSYIIKRVLNRADKKFYKSLSIDRKKKPLIIHFSTTDQTGGAAKAAFNIHKGLLANNQNSLMFVSRRDSNEESVILAKERTGFSWIFDLVINFNKNRKYKKMKIKKEVMHSFQNQSFLDLKLILKIFKPDIVHLHWIGFNFISIELLSEIQVPIIWTMHDMWPFSGAEHVCFDEAYKLGYPPENEANFSVWERKKKAYADLKIYPVGVSRWISNIAKESVLFSKYEIQVIPNILNTEKFYPRDLASAQSSWNFPTSGKLLLFGSDYKDENKGYFIIEELVKKYEEEKRSDIVFVVFGHAPIELNTQYVKIIHLGYIKSGEDLTLLYSAADVTLVPSKIESFCLTAAESIACGTPVVSFDTSGLKDIVQDGVSGYRSICFDVSDFKKNIDKTLIEKENNQFKRNELHQFIKENFSEEKVVSSYLELYKSVYSDR